MRASSIKIFVITALFVNYVASDAKSQTTNDTSIGTSNSASKWKDYIPSVKAAVSSSKNASTVKTLEYWMSRMGSMRNDLINVQAVIVKDEDVKGGCVKADRKSNKRYLMCAGSILNRNHVLTSATCLHEATHIRHNVRAPLSVVIAPLKPSIQVIAVEEYQVHPHHNTNPYAKDHTKHNIAIVKLSCRIDMVNFHRIEFPHSPMIQTCSEENCIVAVYRKTGGRSYVMFQVLAPIVPIPNRRRKETSVNDADLQRSRQYRKAEMINGAIRLERPKRKLAEPPIFVRRYESRMKFNGPSSNSTSEFDETSIENSTSEPATTILPVESKNLSFAAERSLHDDVFKALKGSSLGNETVKSFVVRSSQGYHACAQTGAPIMLNNTQAALVAIPCDDRQPLTRWQYSDLWDNRIWIQETLNDWESYPNISGPGIKPPEAGNYSGCSTCIFNFFIEIGCKDKGQCGKNITGLHGAHLPGQSFPKSESNMGGARRKSQGCSGRNTVGIEVGIGQGCEKNVRETETRAEYGGKSLKPIVATGNKQKHLSQPNGAIDDSGQLQQPVTGGPMKTSVRDYIVDNEKYPRKVNTRVSAISQTYKTPLNRDDRRERVTNEIGLQNIDGDSTDWLSEVEKGLELSSEVKRESVKSRRSNIK